MKILFLGTPEFSAEILRRIPKKHTIVGVVSQPDRAKDRKGNLLPTPLKKYAVEHGIKVYQFERIKKCVDEVKEIDADIFVTAAYGQILSQEIIDLPKYGIINVHTSLLPLYRGSSPIQSAILNGDKITGVTIMQTDVGMDTGDILMSKSVEIKERTAGELSEELIEVGSALLNQTLDMIENGTVRRIKQDDSKATKCKMISDEDALIKWDEDSEHIYNRIRAYNPSPVAYTTFCGERIKIYKATLCNEIGQAGQVLCADKNGIAVACGKGAINITVLQPSGKKAMDAAAFLNGKKIKQGDYFGN